MSIRSFTRPRRREKIFGHQAGPRLDRNAKARLIHRARQLARRTVKGRHYGALTGKDVDVLAALCWLHHEGSGRCYPRYETIADQAGCSRSHVATALRRLEACGLLTWVNGLTRIVERDRDLWGQIITRRRVIRTSNSYRLLDPQPCKSKFQPGPMKQDSKTPVAELPPILIHALDRLKSVMDIPREEMDGPKGPKQPTMCG